MTRSLRAMPRLLLGAGLLFALRPAWEQARAQDFGASVGAAADAKPIFLTTRAAARGEDPTDPAVIARLAEYHQIYRGGHRIQGRLPPGKGSPYASLYPPTLPALLAEVAPESWRDFAAWWRRTGLALLLLGGAAAGAAGGRRLGRVSGAIVGLAVALWCTPGVDTALQLGQANLHLAGLSGLALLGLSLWAGPATGLLLAAGATLKLAPLALTPVLALGRRWTGLAALGCGLLVAILAASPTVSPLAQLHDIQASLAYAGSLNPVWLESRHNPPPRWLWRLWAVRGTHLGLVTATLVCLWPRLRRRVRNPAPLRAASGALILAWLALVAAPGQLIYGPLILPPLAWLAGRALAPERLLSTTLWATLALGAAGALSLGRGPSALQSLDPAGALTGVAGLVWWCTAAELTLTLSKELPRPWRRRLPVLGATATTIAVLWLGS